MNRLERDPAALDDRCAVVIFTDEPGWHGKRLRAALAEEHYDARFASLCDCALDMSGPEPRIAIPTFAGLPQAAFVRGVAGGTLEQIISRLNILHSLRMIGIPVFNDGRAIERTVDKGLTSFLLSRHGIPTPRTWVLESTEAARAIAAREFLAGKKLVLKPLFGSQGNGVVQMGSLDAFDQQTPATGVYYLQEYIDAGEGDFRDWRVFVIHGRAAAAMQRRSSHWVTNRAQGAICEPVTIRDGQLAQLAEAAATALDVDYAGIDLLRDHTGRWFVGEVNGIPAWQGLQRASGVNITQHLVAAFIEKIRKQSEFAAAG
jgi:RimK family alpha-L-glutamate ligase